MYTRSVAVALDNVRMHLEIKILSCLLLGLLLSSKKLASHSGLVLCEDACW